MGEITGNELFRRMQEAQQSVAKATGGNNFRYQAYDTSQGWAIVSEEDDKGKVTHRLGVVCESAKAMSSFVATARRAGYTVDEHNPNGAYVHLKA